MKAVQLSVLLLLLSTAAASEDDASAAEQTSDISEMPERAVFEVAHRYTVGLGGGAQWKVYGHHVKSGRYGPRVTHSLQGDKPAFVFYDAKGIEVAREYLLGLTDGQCEEVLKRYGFFPGDTREPTVESAPPKLATASGGSCKARRLAKKQAAAAAAAEAQGEKTATQLAEAAATAAAAAAKAANAAAAAAEAAVAALAALQGIQQGTCEE